MTKFISSLLFALTLIFIFSCKKKVFPEEGKYTIAIDSIRKSTAVSEYDTIWFTVSPQDEKTPIVTLGNEYGFANPKIVNSTKKYLVLNRNFYEYNYKKTIRIAVLAYGIQQSYIDTPYETTTKTNNIKLSGKILFKTSSSWVLWDLGANRVINTTSPDLNVVDYNSALGKILVKSGSYLYYYNEDFSTYTSYNNPDFYFASNICFIGTSSSISYFSSNDRYGHTFSPPSSISTIQPNSYYYTMCSFNTSQNINAQVMYDTYYYYLKYSINNSNIYKPVTYSSYNSYDNIEISADGKYLVYTDSRALNIFRISTESELSLFTIAYDKPCFDYTSSKLSFVDSDHNLIIYDIFNDVIRYPLSNTMYSSSSIYQAYW